MAIRKWLEPPKAAMGHPIQEAKLLLAASRAVARLDGFQLKVAPVATLFRTVSGIRGQALLKPMVNLEPHLKIKCSKVVSHFSPFSWPSNGLPLDIIFLWALYSIQRRKFYNPVTSLRLLNKSQCSGMRLTGQNPSNPTRRKPQNPLSINSTYKKNRLISTSF